MFAYMHCEEEKKNNRKEFNINAKHTHTYKMA
jgi:hypothetical protein